MKINQNKIDLTMNNNNSIMDLHKLSKTELLTKCEELGITKCKTKKKSELISLITEKKYLMKMKK